MYHTEVLRFSTAVNLVGASPVTIKPALANLPDDLPLIAADGGASVLLALGRVPDVVIGDMDSLVSRDALPSSSRSSISQDRMILILKNVWPASMRR